MGADPCRSPPARQPSGDGSRGRRLDNLNCMQQLGTAENPLRVAIVGSARPASTPPASCSSSTEPVVTVDVFDRLMTPWGLVRFGVAPDHPKIKSVTRVFERTARTARLPLPRQRRGRRGRHPRAARGRLSRGALRGRHAGRPRLGIPGEELPGSESATEFVAWYNGHPDYADMDFDLSCKRAVVVGNGNVALDVARMLALSVDELPVTDIADHAIELLRASEVEEIVVLGRRGPAQAAFTNPELRELADLELADVIVDPADMRARRRQRGCARGRPTAPPQRNVETLTEYAALTPAGKPRRVVLRFLDLAGRDRGRRPRSRRSSSSATSWSPARTARSRPRPTGETRADRDRPRAARRSATSVRRSRACRSTIARRPCSTGRPRARPGPRASRFPACTPPAGSSAAPPA